MRNTRAMLGEERARRPDASTLALASRVVLRRAYWKAKLAVRRSPHYDRVEFRVRRLLLPANEALRRRSSSPWPVRDSTTLRSYRRCHFYAIRRGYWDEMHEFMRRLIVFQELAAQARGLDPSARRFIGRDFLQNLGCLTMLDLIAKQEILAGDLGRNVVLASPEWVSNPCFLDHWRAYFTVVDDPAAVDSLEQEAGLLSLHAHTWRGPDGRLQYYLDAAAETEARWHAEGRGPLLRLSDDERAAGWSSLVSLGVPRDGWFVALHAREGSGYDSVRDVEIATYRKAIEAVVGRGGWVVRMGGADAPPLPEWQGVVDYAHSSAKSASMDVFIGAACRFMIGTASGPTGIAAAFGVPAVTTNWLLPHRNWFRNHLSLVKLYRSEREQRYLTFTEAMSTRVAFLPDRNELASLGVTVVDNTAEEIAEAVLEMLERLEGRAVYTEDDDALQRRFHASVPRLRHPIPAGGARIGREFLRRHRDLCA